MPIQDVFDRHAHILPGRIIHIGACLCEERDLYLRHGVSDADVVWIEANPDLVERAREMFPRATIRQGLISDRAGTQASFHITNNLQSSSMIELHEHFREHPRVVKTRTIILETTTVPALLKQNGLPTEGYDSKATTSSTWISKAPSCWRCAAWGTCCVASGRSTPR